MDPSGVHSLKSIRKKSDTQTQTSIFAQSGTLNVTSNEKNLPRASTSDIVGNEDEPEIGDIKGLSSTHGEDKIKNNSGISSKSKGKKAGYVVGKKKTIDKKANVGTKNSSLDDIDKVEENLPKKENMPKKENLPKKKNAPPTLVEFLGQSNFSNDPCGPEVDFKK